MSHVNELASKARYHSIHALRISEKMKDIDEKKDIENIRKLSRNFKSVKSQL